MVVWNEYKTVQSWLGYSLAYVLLVLGIYLLSDLNFSPSLGGIVNDIHADVQNNTDSQEVSSLSKLKNGHRHRKQGEEKASSIWFSEEQRYSLCIQHSRGSSFFTTSQLFLRDNSLHMSTRRRSSVFMVPGSGTSREISLSGSDDTCADDTY